MCRSGARELFVFEGWGSQGTTFVLLHSLLVKFVDAGLTSAEIRGKFIKLQYKAGDSIYVYNDPYKAKHPLYVYIYNLYNCMYICNNMT